MRVTVRGMTPHTLWAEYWVLVCSVNTVSTLRYHHAPKQVTVQSQTLLSCLLEPRSGMCAITGYQKADKALAPAVDPDWARGVSMFPAMARGLDPPPTSSMRETFMSLSGASLLHETWDSHGPQTPAVACWSGSPKPSGA